MAVHSIQEKLSLAYLKAIVAKADFALQESLRDVDNVGYDVTIFCSKEIQKYAPLHDEIFAQVKSVMNDSSTMFQEDADNITYTLSKSYSAKPNKYLLVFVLPAETTPDEWCKVSADELVLKHCMYYIKMPAKAGKITIPKANQLTPDSIKTLFISKEAFDE